MSLDIVDNDSLVNILQYCQAEDAARIGICSMTWNEKIYFHGKLWKTFATTRWGDAVTLDSGNETAATSSWYEYYRHRCSWTRLPASKSKLDLIQEDYGHDPYKLLSACILCSRTSGSQTVKDTVKSFFAKYRKPSDVLSGEIATMEKELKPLGLNREKTMKKFAEGFLKPWTHVHELHGCGAFASSSFQVFCRGDFASVLREKKCDRNVRAYASYLKRVVDQTEGKVVDVANDNYNAPETTKRKAKQKKTQSRKRATLPRRKSRRNC